MPKPVAPPRGEQERGGFGGRPGGRPGGQQGGRGNGGRSGGSNRTPRPAFGSPLMSRDGYGRDEIPVSDRGPRTNPIDGQRQDRSADRSGKPSGDRAGRADNRPNHKRGGPPISAGSQSRDGERPRNYGPKPAGIGRHKDAVKRAR
jgi:hypothetical protein